MVIPTGVKNTWKFAIFCCVFVQNRLDAITKSHCDDSVVSALKNGNLFKILSGSTRNTRFGVVHINSLQLSGHARDPSVVSAVFEKKTVIYSKFSPAVHGPLDLG